MSYIYDISVMEETGVKDLNGAPQYSVSNPLGRDTRLPNLYVTGDIFMHSKLNMLYQVIQRIPSTTKIDCFQLVLAPTGAVNPKYDGDS